MIACHAENQCSSVASAVCLNARALAGSNVHGQWPASALLEDHREEQLSDGARACADAGHGFCLQPISVLTLCFAGQVGEVHHKERRISVQSVASVCCNKVKLRATGIPLGSFVMNHVYTFARIIKTYNNDGGRTPA